MGRKERRKNRKKEGRIAGKEGKRKEERDIEKNKKGTHGTQDKGRGKKLSRR